MKLLRWLGFVLLLGLPGLRLGAAVVTVGPVVELVGGTNAVIRWTTDVATGSRVQFGLRPGRLDQRGDGEVGAAHVVVLRDLKPGTQYHFTVGTARQPLATNRFVTPDPGAGVGVGAGNAATNRASPTRAQVPPTRETWGNLATLQDHFDRHGPDFKSRSPDDYARQAWEFLQRGRAEGLPAKLDEDGVMRVYDPKSGTFAAYNRDGTTKTYFKPESRTYFERQPGRPFNLKTGRWPGR